jgi:hypothetical protein
MPGSMSGEEKRRDGLLGERSNERRRAHLAPPVLYAPALLLDSTGHVNAIGSLFLAASEFCPRESGNRLGLVQSFL